MPMFNPSTTSGSVSAQSSPSTSSPAASQGQPNARQGLRYLSPGVYRDAQGRLVNSQGQPINGQRGSGSNGSSTQPNGQAPRTNQPNVSQQPLSDFRGFLMGNPFGEKAMDAFNSFADFAKNNAPNFNNAPALPGVNDFAGERQRIEDGLYNRARNDLDTRYKTETDQFEQDMANQGIDIGNPRYQKEKELFLRGRDQAYNDARFQAMRDSGDEQVKLFDQALSARRQGTSEAESLSAQRINNLAAMLNPTVGLGQLQNSRDMVEADQRFKAKEAQKDRAIKLKEIASQGGGGLDFNKLMELIKQLTGEDLAG